SRVPETPAGRPTLRTRLRTSLVIRTNLLNTYLICKSCRVAHAVWSGAGTPGSSAGIGSPEHWHSYGSVDDTSSRHSRWLRLRVSFAQTSSGQASDPGHSRTVPSAPVETMLRP